MKYEKLFVYGTLKDSDVQERILGRTIKGVPDVLEGYRKSEIKINDNTYPIIKPCRNGSIKGLVLLVTKKELKLIDEYETKAYKREKIVLKSRVNAWVYQK